MTPKIATCCYCGARAVLVLTGETRQELACSNCGAPLSEMKMLRRDVVGDRGLVRPSPIRQHRSKDPRYRSKGKRTKQKSLAQRFMEDIWDEVEDIFDVDIFD